MLDLAGVLLTWKARREQGRQGNYFDFAGDGGLGDI